MKQTSPFSGAGSASGPVLNTLVGIVHEEALAAGLLNADSKETIEAAMHSALKRGKAGDADPVASENQFQAMIEPLRKLAHRTNGDNPTQIINASKVLGVDVIVANMVMTLQQVMAHEPPAVSIKRYLSAHMMPNVSREKHDNFIAELKKAFDTAQGDAMLFSLVHTMHPTIYHSDSARQLEKDLIELFESSVKDRDSLAEAGQNPARRILGGSALASPTVEAFREKVRDYLQKLKDGATTLTPVHQVTVKQENKLEKDNLAVIHKELDAMADAWNQAIEELELPQECQFTPERRQKMFELRKWGNFADADGRPKSTSIGLYGAIEDAAKENGGTPKDKWDLRQNAAIHRDFVSALIQVKYFNARHHMYGEEVANPKTGKNFAEFCEAFMDERRTQYADKWKSPRDLTFGELKPEDQAQFIKELTIAGYELVPRQVREDVLEFTALYHNEFSKFIQSHNELICGAGLDPETITYDQLKAVFLPAPNPQSNLQMAFRAVINRKGFEITDSGLGYQRIFATLDAETAPAGECEKAREQNRVHDFLEKRFVYDEKNKRTVQLEQHERITLMDTIKRLIVVDRALDTYDPEGKGLVADRHQIANFASPADFIIMLKLFEESGLVTLDGEGKVTKAKMDIQPLIETVQDMKNARAIFETLLDDDLVLSFFKARGNKAQVMLGFSDGAASAGNFASQSYIYKVKQELTELFASRGIDLRILEGRGEGTDRGGTVDPSLVGKMQPPECAEKGVYDVTVQSSLPTRLAESQKSGEDYFTKMLLGTLDARITARAMTQEDKTLLKQFQPVRDWIANRALEEYKKLVSENPDALKFLSNAPDNPNRSSRGANRNADNKSGLKYVDFEKVRAIIKEYLFDGAKMPVYNVGLKQALDELSKMSPEQVRQQVYCGHSDLLPYSPSMGNNMDGKEILSALKGQNFFSGMMEITQASMQRYDPAIAKMYGEITHTDQFVDAIVQQLNGLSRTVEKLTVGDAGIAKWLNGVFNKRTQAANAGGQLPALVSALDQVTHAFLGAASREGLPMQESKSKKTTQGWIEGVYNFLFTISQRVGNVSLPPHHQEISAAVSAR